MPLPQTNLPTTSRLRRRLASLLLGTLLTAPSLWAQLAPSAQDIAAYRGLHDAAHRGDAARIATLVAAGAPVDERDGHGRTPLHVATFARQSEVIRALVQAGAQTSLLDADRYDAVTIAAVADDEHNLGVLLRLGASAKLITSRYDGTALIAAAHLGHEGVGSSRVDLQACKLEYSIVSPK